MKTLAPLLLAVITFGCAHEAIEQPTPPYHASVPAPSFTTDATIALAQKNYTNGLVPEAFSGLLRDYDETHDLKCLEFAAELTDREIRWMQAQFDDKSKYLSDTQDDLDDFYSYDISIQKEIGHSAYDMLRSEDVEHFSKEEFIPRTDQTKNAMIRVQEIVSSEIANPNVGEYDRLLKLGKKVNGQRESICKLRTEYISEVFIGPRVDLGGRLIYLAEHDLPGGGYIPFSGVNSYWVEKLELLFTKDYGNWIAQSDEQTRLQFVALVRTCKNALGEADYKDFQTVLDLLSNNKKGGSDLWWPAETSNQ